MTETGAGAVVIANREPRHVGTNCFGRPSTQVEVRIMPEDGWDTLRGHDAILFGAVGDPTVPDTIPVHQLLLPMRRKFDQYVNLRPAYLFAGVPCPLVGKRPGDIDMLVYAGDALPDGTQGIGTAPPPVGTVAPEPSSLVLLATGALGVVGSIRRRFVS